MTDDLDNLRPEVRRANSFLDSMACSEDERAAVHTIRAELLRLTRNDADARIALDADHDWKEMYERAKKAEAELADLKVKYTRLNEVCENTVRCLCEQDDEADRNEAELAALKDKIADAPITQVTRMAAIGGGGYEWAGCRVPDAWNGKRVRLVVEE